MKYFLTSSAVIGIITLIANTIANPNSVGLQAILKSHDLSLVWRNLKMYFLPGYVTYYKREGKLYIKSNLFHNEVEISDEDKQNEFYSKICRSGCESLSSPLAQFLHEQELLQTREEIAATLNEVKTLLKSVLELTIMPTEACNFRCLYCYETHNAVYMDKEHQKHLHSFILAKAPEHNIVRINWFGGEPTLCKNFIHETCSLVMSLQSEYGFKYISGMTTNGYLLTVDNFLDFYHMGIKSYQITLDGNTHDNLRIHVLGTPTLNTILDNLKAISLLPQNKFEFEIVLRHNILSNDMDFSWYDRLFSLFGKDKRFKVLVRGIKDWGGKSVSNLNIMPNEQEENICASHNTYIDKIGLQRDRDINDIFSKVCYACYPHGFVFRADGRIEKCTIALDHPKNMVGRIDPIKGVVIWNTANQQWSDIPLLPECYSCQDVLSCLNLRCGKKYCITKQGKAHCPYFPK